MKADSTTRASDRDRDTVARLLGEQAALGRLTPTELEERTAAALSASTWGELHALTTDLPVEPGPLNEQAEHSSPRRGPARLPRCLSCLPLLALIVLAGSLDAAAPVVLLVAVASCVAIGAKTGGCVGGRSWR